MYLLVVGTTKSLVNEWIRDTFAHDGYSRLNDVLQTKGPNQIPLSNLEANVINFISMFCKDYELYRHM